MSSLVKSPPQAASAAPLTTAPSAAAVSSVSPLASISIGQIIQQAVNVLIPIINNTPIRSLLDLIEGSGGSAGSVIRLLGQPVATVSGPNGTIVYAVSTGLLTSSVTEIDTKTNTVIGVPVALPGAPAGHPVISPDGNRAYITSTGAAVTGAALTFVTTINTANDTVTGTAVVAGTPAGGSLLLSPDATHVFRETAVGSDTLAVSVIDAKTGSIVGDPVTINGFEIGPLEQSPDGTRVFQSSISNVGTTTVTVIDAATSSVVGQPLTLAGVAAGGVAISPAGDLVAQATQSVSGPPTTTVTLIDPHTSSVVGVPVTLDGWPDLGLMPSSTFFTLGGARVNEVTQDGVASPVLTVIQTATGTVVGTPVVVGPAGSSGVESVVPDPVGGAIYVASVNPGSDSTLATVVDTNTSTVVGSPVVLDGTLATSSTSLIVSLDRSRVYQATNVETASSGGTPAVSYATVAAVGADGTSIWTTQIQGSARTPIILSPDGSTAYLITATLGSLITAINTTTGAVTSTPITITGLASDGLALTPDTAYLTTTVTFLEVPFFFTYFPLNYTRLTAIPTSQL